MLVSVSILTIVGGSLALLWGLIALMKARQSKSWPSVPGIVCESCVKRSAAFDSNVPTTTAHVLYEYRVGSETYRSNTIQFGRNNSTQSARNCEDTVAKYPVGSRVHVYYNPNKPKQSILQPGSITFAIPGLLIGVIFIGVGIGMTLLK